MNRINAYDCSNCDYQIITIDRDEGTTPFMITCPKCKEMAMSNFYRVAQNLAPTHEFYRPNQEEYDTLLGEEKEYIGKGGLILREIK